MSAVIAAIILLLICSCAVDSPSRSVSGDVIAAVENGGSNCRVDDLPDFPELQDTDGLPDPFLSLSGERISRYDEWVCRRAEIAEQVQRYQLGPKPSDTAKVSGEVDGDRINVVIRVGDRDTSIAATINLPEDGNGPYPAMIVLGRGTALDTGRAISGQGVAIITVDNDDIAEQINGGSRGKGKFYDLYPQHPAGAMMAWAWGISRLIDALANTPEARIDTARLGVTGCSRNGKGALVAGAFDERIALTISQESGAGGASLWRLADVHQKAWLDGGKVPEHGAVQTLSQIVEENVWFRESFRRFSTKATRLPFDQHMTMALIAPRSLLVVNNTDMWWLDRQGSHLGAVVAHEVWSALGVPDAMGTTQVGGHPHCTGVPQSQLDVVAAFVSKFLLGDNEETTDVLYTDGEFPDLWERWIDWDTPKLVSPIQFR